VNLYTFVYFLLIAFKNVYISTDMYLYEKKLVE